MCFVTCKVHWIMDWITSRVMESDLQGIEIQIGQGVHLTGKELQGVALVWARQLCCGSVGCFELV